VSLTPLPAIALWMVCTAVMATPVNANRGTDMSELIQAAREAVGRYDKAKEPLLLRDAGETLERVDLFAPPGPEQRAEARRQTLDAWLLILSRVDAAKNPPLDMNDPPSTKVGPRSVPGQPAYLPGVDPKQITDPQVRADYEKAIAENNQKIERWRHYWDLNAIDMEVSDGAKRFVRRFYTSSPADQTELRAAMAHAGIGARREKQLATPAAARP
jgi:hypothetical protein